MIQELSPDDVETAWLQAAVRDEPYRSLLQPLAPFLSIGEEWYLVGGSVRDILLRKLTDFSGTMHDLDIVVQLEDRLDPLLETLPGTLARTPLGGHRWFPPVGSRYVDLWTVRDSYVITQFHLPASIHNVLAGFPFNLERICLGLKTGNVLDGGCLEGIRARTIRFDTLYPHSLAVQAARAMMLLRKTGFHLDTTVHNLLHGSRWRERRDDISAYLLANGYTLDDVSDVMTLLEQHT